jgi:hypothetical protein
MGIGVKGGERALEGLKVERLEGLGGESKNNAEAQWKGEVGGWPLKVESSDRVLLTQSAQRSQRKEEGHGPSKLRVNMSSPRERGGEILVVMKRQNSLLD